MVEPTTEVATTMTGGAATAVEVTHGRAKGRDVATGTTAVAARARDAATGMGTSRGWVRAADKARGVTTGTDLGLVLDAGRAGRDLGMTLITTTKLLFE